MRTLAEASRPRYYYNAHRWYLVGAGLLYCILLASKFNFHTYKSVMWSMLLYLVSILFIASYFMHHALRRIYMTESHLVVESFLLFKRQIPYGAIKGVTGGNISGWLGQRQALTVLTNGRIPFNTVSLYPTSAADFITELATHVPGLLIEKKLKNILQNA